jgi:hypothetical protein
MAIPAIAASSVAVAPCGHATRRTLFFIASGRASH